jgi:hypothetical protein
MQLMITSRRFSNTVLCLAVVLLVSACSGSTQLTRQFLDERTGVTVTSSGTPLVLYRDNPAQAAYARNLVHVGPIEVNRMGSFRYYLWVGIWNTMEDVVEDRVRASFDTITIFADGEPLPLELAGATVSAIGASRPPYLKPVASASDAYYEVTADQIRVIAEAKEIRLRTGGSSPRDYQPWDNQKTAYKGFEAFLDSALL